MELNVTQEITRKTLEYCELAALRYTQGVYSDREFSLVMDAAWQCTAGITEGLQAVMDDVAMENLSTAVRRVAYMPGTTRTLVFERDDRTVCVRTLDMKVAHNIQTHDTQAQAVEAINKAVRRLQKEGFIII